MSFASMIEESVRADKLSNTGAVYYSIWLDKFGNEYLKINSVIGGYGSGNGTFNNYIYLVSEIGIGSPVKGFDACSGAIALSHDNNMSGFLRAAKADLMRRKQAEKDAKN